MTLPDAAFTSDQVVRLTGISKRRLNYWLDAGIIRADIEEARGRGRVRLWSFANLVEVRSALWLREKISLQLLREVVNALRRRRLASSLADVRLGVVETARRRSRVVIQREDGQWEETLTGQVVMELTVPIGRFRSELERGVMADRRRRRAPGKIERQRGRLGSTPVFAGTRMPVSTVQRLRKAGWSTKQICEEFPGLTAADVRASERTG